MFMKLLLEKSRTMEVIEAALRPDSALLTSWPATLGILCTSTRTLTTPKLHGSGSATPYHCSQMRADRSSTRQLMTPL